VRCVDAQSQTIQACQVLHASERPGVACMFAAPSVQLRLGSSVIEAGSWSEISTSATAKTRLASAVASCVGRRRMRTVGV
jgi:hypothetical protein